MRDHKPIKDGQALKKIMYRSSNEIIESNEQLY